MTQKIPIKPDISEFGLDKCKISKCEALIQRSASLKKNTFIGCIIIVSIFLSLHGIPSYYGYTPDPNQSAFDLLVYYIGIIFFSLIIQGVTIIPLWIYNFISTQVSNLIISTRDNYEIEKYNKYRSVLSAYNSAVEEFWDTYPDSKPYGQRIEDYLKDKEIQRLEYQKKENERRKQIQYWFNLSGYEFEKEVAKIYEKIGYRVIRKGQSSDGGIDIILWDSNKNKIIVQCKNHKKPIGPAIVRDLYGVMMAEKANKAILICSGGFTQGVLSFAKSKPIELLNVYKIIQLYNKYCAN